MIAIDTNVVVRYLVADHRKQFARARTVIESQPVFVCMTVVLEVEWVLRAIYRLARPAVLHALRSFAALPTVVVEDPAILAQALDWAGQGMEFADALHLASASSCDAFVSFDRKLLRAAQKAGALEVRAP
jgi:predicted nucleic-acid-binding protein